MALTYYNYTMPGDTGTNVSSVVGLFQWANEATNYVFGIGILFSFLMISFLTMLYRTGSARKSLAPALFVTTIIGILMRAVDIISGYMITIIIILFTASMVWLMLGEEGY